MKSNLKFDFAVNNETNTVTITREFEAGLDLVWEAWTNPEILDQWWAPKPYSSRTKYMDFKVGGRRFYAMVNEQGVEMGWHIQEYLAITPKTHFKFFSVFADKDENRQLPGSTWDLNFTEENGKTTVFISIFNESRERMEKMIQTGFKEGFTAGLENLERYIEAQFRIRKQNKTHHMARVSTYLNFPGNTEEAFTFYKKVFKSEFINGIQRFGDLPPDPNQPPVADAVKKMILHIELPILGGHILMGTDAPREMGFTVTKGNNMHIQIEPESRDEARRLFDELSEGGVVEMPIQDMFWGAYFGSFQDKYGINWMVNHQSN